jgi:hypothetical protein
LARAGQPVVRNKKAAFRKAASFVRNGTKAKFLTEAGHHSTISSKSFVAVNDAIAVDSFIHL